MHRFISLYHVASSGLNGSSGYRAWMSFLCFWITLGVWSYIQQVDQGLAVTGMHDHVSWGLYISNFTFLVGLAAASVMLVLPCYILKQIDFKQAVIIGEGVAVAALLMCLCFVVADMGRPQDLWHMIPGIGRFNWPSSMLTWDVIVLNVYLVLNICIPAYLLYCKYHNKEPNHRYVFFVYLSVFWAVAIHLVTAFLYAGLPARPFWNSSLLGPRFLASAFAGGPAFIIIALIIIKQFAKYDIRDIVIDRLALVATVAAQINLVMLGSELFKEFYAQTAHSLSAQYLFFGLHGHDSLVPWIRTAIFFNILATVVLSIHSLRRNKFVYS